MKTMYIYFSVMQEYYIIIFILMGFTFTKYLRCVTATHGLLRGYISGFVYLNIWACGSFYATNFDQNQKYNVNLTRIKRNYLIWLMIHLKLTLQTWVLKSSFWPGRKHCGLYIQFFSMMCAQRIIYFIIFQLREPKTRVTWSKKMEKNRFPSLSLPFGRQNLTKYSSVGKSRNWKKKEHHLK